ncbi:hypothetical protein MTBPR1_190002 [Candidatus Terasakiella magnetica]|uniref:Response regulatory domain-containing protein n=1 Tax=Candidatus Terasakiella magnetica TaxID=1867952 RepID=A0A1C3RFY4_9PROT|nr:response regulator [Candidatus Terasakiella magnetica]SCA56124.1 hypothetical protein MTBPR1_190002 [Candidatus Terasakiella magnetica]
MPKILFVDDEDLVLEGIRRNLMQMRDDWQFHYVNNAQDAVKTVEQEEDIDFCITDIRMPFFDGFQLISYLEKQHPKISIFVLSGQCDHAERTRFEERNILFFEKPFPAEMLTTAIEMKIFEKSF